MTFVLVFIYADRRKSAMPRPLPVLLALLLLLAGACVGGTSSADTADDPTSGDSDAVTDIVVTTTILGDVVRSLVQGDATVEVLMPPGSDPHSFSPSAAQADAMRRADLLVVNGAGAEEGMLDVITAAEADGTPTVEAISAVDPIDRDDDHAEDDGHEGGVDPHFWQDPSRMASVVTALAQRIAEVDDTLEDEEWTARGDALAEQMLELDAEAEQILSRVPADRRILVTNHEAFGYLADRYGFQVLGTVIPGGGTLAEPSAAGLEVLVDALEETGVPAIFAESINPSALADAVAAEVGTDVEVVLLHSDSLSPEGGDAATYEALVRHNATAIADALA